MYLVWACHAEPVEYWHVNVGRTKDNEEIAQAYPPIYRRVIVHLCRGPK